MFSVGGYLRFYLITLLDRKQIKTYVDLAIDSISCHIVDSLTDPPPQMVLTGCKAVFLRALVPGFKENICPHEAPLCGDCSCS